MIVHLFARDFQEPPRIQEMCEGTAKKFKVTKILFSRINKKETKKGVTIIRVKGKSFMVTLNKIDFNDLLKFGLYGAKEIKKLNKKQKIKILHCHRHSALIPAFFSKVIGVKAKIILDYHDPWSGESTFNLKENIPIICKLKIALFHLFERISFKFIDHIIVVSEPQKELLKKRYNLKDTKFTKINNSAAAYHGNFTPKRKNKKRFGWENKKIIMFTGCIVPYFGLDLLINSVPLVIKRVPNALFIIKIAEEIKEKKYYMDLLNKIKKYNIEKRVIFIDEWMSSKKYSAFISSADIGIICHKHTLLTETADPDKLYEYLAAGLPIVATKLKIMKTFVKNKKNGFIVKHNSKKIAKAIIEILTNKKLRKKMGKKSYEMRFDWGDEFRKLLLLYQKLMENENRKIK